MTKAGPNLLGVALRGFSLVSKFALVLYITKYFSLEELGQFGLMATTQVIAVYMVGFEFHQYAGREILSRREDERGEVIWSHLKFLLASHVAAVPLLLVFAVAMFGDGIGYWLLPLVVGSHFSMEAQRLLITLGRPRAAFVITTFANSAWVLVVLPLGLIDAQFRTLHVVFGAWAVAALLAMVGSALFLRRGGMLTGDLSQGNWRCVRRGLQISVPFVVMVVLSRTIDSADRYFIVAFWSDAELGIYTFYNRIASTLHEFVAVGIVTVAFPRLVGSFQRGEGDKWRRERRRFSLSVLASTAALVPCYVGGIYLLLALVGSDAIRADLPSYFVLVAGYALLALSLIPSSILYAWNSDRSLLLAALAAAIVNVAGNIALVPTQGVQGAAISTLLAALSLVVVRGTLQWRQEDAHRVES